MKKILIILGIINLTVTSTTNLVACNNTQEYTPEELAQLKKEHQIDTTNETIKNNLEWIAPQEKPFNKVDDKYYYVVWRGNKNNDWIITKFKNNEKIERFHPKNIDIQNEINFNLNNYSQIPVDIDLAINASSVLRWKYDDGSYFKLVYRWNLDTQKPNLILDENSSVKVDGE